jgi:hypothetical protein
MLCATAYIIADSGFPSDRAFAYIFAFAPFVHFVALILGIAGAFRSRPRFGRAVTGMVLNLVVLDLIAFAGIAFFLWMLVPAVITGGGWR